MDVRNTFHPIQGYEPKDAERAFTQYERTRSKITVLGAGRVKISMPMAGMNYVKFAMELNEKPQAIADGIMVFAKVRDEEGEIIVQKRRMVFVKDTEPEITVRGKDKGDCMVVLGIPRLNLTLVDWRVRNS